MSSIIYETINLHNKENNILPFRYIGSDQHNNPNYLGSSKSLKNDIKKLGEKNFEKNIICEFKNEISNVLLRKLESNIQVFMDVAKNPEYYNKTNYSHKGYIETEDEKKIRINKMLEKRKIWWNGLSEIEKEEFLLKSSNRFKKYNNEVKGKTYEEIYGEEKGKIKKEKHIGKNNGMSKQIIDIKTGKIFDTMKDALIYYKIKKYETLRKKCLKEDEMKFI